MASDKIYIGCPECTSFSSSESEHSAEMKVASHNDLRHEGKEVVRFIEPDSEDCVNEFIDDARERAPTKQYKELISKIAKGDTPFTVATLG